MPPSTATDQRTSPMALERTLTYRLHQLHKLTDQISQRSYPERTGLSLSVGRCLTTIGSFEPMSVNDLAHLTHLNKGQASRAAQALVDQGLVLKTERPDDGRGVSLCLSATGRKAWQKAMALVAERNDDIFGCLSKTEQKQLSALLDRLIAQAQTSAAA